MFTMFGYGRCVSWEYQRRWRMRSRRHGHVSSSAAARQAQRIKTTHLKHKTLHDSVCIMEEGPATTGGAAEEAIADEDSRTESESDGAPDAPSGSAPASCSKRPNPCQVVFSTRMQGLSVCGTFSPFSLFPLQGEASTREVIHSSQWSISVNLVQNQMPVG